MLELQGKEIGVGRLVDLQVQLVRTYKGEINRTQTGKIAAFPNSFITVGLQIVLQGSRSDIKGIEQILLSTDVVDLAVDWTTYSFRGKFSCTSNQVTEMKTRDEATSQLAVSLVSDGTPITKPDGSKFTITRSDATTVQAYYGQVLKLASPQQYMNGFALPSNELLVLGDATLTAT